MYGTFVTATNVDGVIQVWALHEDVASIKDDFADIYEKASAKNASEEDKGACVPMIPSQKKCFSTLMDSCQQCVSLQDEFIFANRLLVDAECAQDCLHKLKGADAAGASCPTFQAQGKCLKEIQTGACQDCIQNGIAGGQILDSKCFDQCVDKHLSTYQKSCPTLKNDNMKDFIKYANGLLSSASDANIRPLDAILFYEDPNSDSADVLMLGSYDNQQLLIEGHEWQTALQNAEQNPENGTVYDFLQQSADGTNSFNEEFANLTPEEHAALMAEVQALLSGSQSNNNSSDDDKN